MTEVTTSYTWASVANSCWCYRVRTIISPYNAIVAGSHHQFKSYRWNSWWVFFLSCIHLVKARCEFQTFQDPNLFLKNAELGIYKLLFEKQSRNDSSGIWIGRRDTTRHMMMGPSWALAKAILLKKTGIRLESREKLEIITAKPKWLQVGSKLATLKRSPAVSMWTWTGERYDRSRLALRVSPRIVKRSCSYMREVNVRECELNFSVVLIFLTGVRNSRWMKNALISYYTTWYANSLLSLLLEHISWQ